MKFGTSFAMIVACAASSSSCSAAFQAPAVAFVVNRNQRSIGSSTSLAGFDLSGNTWKPDSEKMGSTDTGDYFPEDYNPEVEFTEGMMGSQMGGRTQDGPQLPGMENLGEDAVMMGGIDEASDIPADMEFIPSSVPDGEFQMSVAASGNGQDLDIVVPPVCMTFEDFFAAFAPGSHPSLSVTPSTGRMDRRGGEPSHFTIRCEPNGQAGNFEGDLVINLPEDNSKICYKVKANCF